MRERWRKPLVVLDYEPGDEVFTASDGRTFRTTKVIYDRESTERIRLGYACAKCMEVWEQAWPERCPMCGAPIASRQREYFEKEFGGFVRLGPKTSLDEEAERIHEELARQGDAGKEKP